MMKNDTGTTQLEAEDDELTPEQLQMLGVEEYPEPTEPRWMPALDTGLLPRRGDFRNHAERIRQLNDERFYQMLAERNRPSSLVFGGSELASLDPYNGQTFEFTTLDEIAPVFTETTSTQSDPELEMETPTYENLREMIDKFAEDVDED
jgi:spore coat protein CotH